MTELQNYQWELDGLVFGYNQPIEHEPDVAPGEQSFRTQDGTSPVGDANTFGRDKIEPGTWTFKLFTNVEDEAEAMTLRAQIRKVWRADGVRNTPGAVMPLRYRLGGGETRVVYGRPRRFASPLDNQILSGLAKITCDFRLASDLSFDDVERNYPIGSVAPTAGGFESDFETPLTTEEGIAQGTMDFVVGGELDTPGIFDFHGPCSDPVIEIDGGAITIQLFGDIPPGITVTVDSRPWIMSTYRSDGAGVAGLLSRRTRLPNLMLSPGPHYATYAADDPTGASGGTVRWRNAHPSD